MRVLLALLCFVSPVFAETAVATRSIPARSVLVASDLASGEVFVPGGTSIAEAVGMEVRTTIYQGRPVLRVNLTAPALVTRNQIVRLVFQRSGLSISAEGRALDRAGAGDVIRVLNTGSRSIVNGFVLEDGSILVSASR